MQTLETYERQADELVQSVVNAWGQNVAAGNSALLAADFVSLFEKACQYRDTQRLNDNRREFKMLSESEAAREKALRLSFAEAYKTYWEKHTTS